MNTKKTITGIAITGIAVTVAIFIYFKYFNPAQSLRSAIAKAFDRPVELIELNLPPADGRYPGSVLVSPKKGQTLVLKKQFRPADTPIASSSISITMDDNAEASVFNKLLGNLTSNGNVKIKIDLTEVRMYEIDISTDLKNELLQNEMIQNADKNKLLPRAITRAYEAIVTYTIDKSSSLSGEAWDKVKDELLDVGGKIISGGGVSINIPEPTIIAYESVLVEFISRNLNQGRPDEIKFKEFIPDLEYVDEAQVLQGYNLGKGNDGVSYVAIGNAMYRSNEFGNLRLVERSTSLVSEVMNAAGAKALINREGNTKITQNGLDRVLDEITDNLKDNNRNKLFVFYYVGHAVSGSNGQMYLVMNDYTGNPKIDIGEDYLHGLSRELLEEPTSPVSGSNFSDLFDAVNAINAEYPEEIQGLYPVSKIANRLKETSSPFIILVDACYAHEQMDKLREVLAITPRGDYFGPEIFGGHGEVKRYAGAIKRFGNVPYLNSENVVMLSSAPGSVALEVPSPKPGLFKNHYVAPLSRKLYNRFESALIDGIGLSYGDFLYGLVDVKELGELNIHGVTSWSDFSEIRKVEMFSELN